MSFHEKIARAAIRDGSTAAEFRTAAQKHANAFWFYAVIGAGVWFFTSWGWALIPFGLAAFVAMQSVSSTLTAKKLEEWGRG